MIDDVELRKLMDQLNSLPDDVFAEPDRSDFDPIEFPQLLQFSTNNRFTKQISRILCGVEPVKKTFFRLYKELDKPGEKNAFVKEAILPKQ